jgi:hypothetical protein
VCQQVEPRQTIAAEAVTAETAKMLAPINVVMSVLLGKVMLRISLCLFNQCAKRPGSILVPIGGEIQPGTNCQSRIMEQNMLHDVDVSTCGDQQKASSNKKRLHGISDTSDLIGRTRT